MGGTSGTMKLLETLNVSWQVSSNHPPSAKALRLPVATVQLGTSDSLVHPLQGPSAQEDRPRRPRNCWKLLFQLVFYTFQWAVCQNHWTIRDMQWLNWRPTHNPIDSDINDESWCPAHGVPNPFNPNEIVTPVMPPSKFPQGQKTSLELDLIELTNLEGGSENSTTYGSKVLATPTQAACQWDRLHTQ